MESPLTPSPPRPSVSVSEQSHRPSFQQGSSSYASSSNSLPSRKQPLTVVVNHPAAAGSNPSQAPASSYSPLTPTPWASSSRHAAHAAAHPDPLVDITRLRVRSQGHHCLYPGAIFQGTQKSGRNSYDVSVTIVVSVRPLPGLENRTQSVSPHVGRRLFVFPPLRLPPHPRTHRRLARAHHLL